MPLLEIESRASSEVPLPSRSIAVGHFLLSYSLNKTYTRNGSIFLRLFTTDARYHKERIGLQQPDRYSIATRQGKRVATALEWSGKSRACIRANGTCAWRYACYVVSECTAHYCL